jgi:hypothetical protein
LLRAIAVLLAVVGVGLLLVMSAHRELPVVRIADITPMMNFAYVRICGTVERDSYVVKDDGEVGYVSFLVSDNTGRARVKAYEAVAKAIAEQGLIPEKGWLVDVAGVVDVSADGGSKLVVRDAGQFRVDITGGLVGTTAAEQPND